MLDHVRGHDLTHATVRVVQLAYIQQAVSLTVVLVDIHVAGQEIFPAAQVQLQFSMVGLRVG